MISNIYVVWDKIAEEAGPPFIAKNDGVAMRNYFRIIEKSNNYKEYELVSIGEFNSDVPMIEVKESRIITPVEENKDATVE